MVLQVSENLLGAGTHYTSFATNSINWGVILYMVALTAGKKQKKSAEKRPKKAESEPRKLRGPLPELHVQDDIMAYRRRFFTVHGNLGNSRLSIST